MPVGYIPQLPILWPAVAAPAGAALYVLYVARRRRGRCVCCSPLVHVGQPRSWAGGTGPQTGWHWPVAGRRRAVVNARAEPAQSLGAIETHVSAVGDPTVQYGMSVPRRCLRCVGPQRVVARGRPPLKGRGEARRRVQARAAADAQARRGRRLEGEPRVATCNAQRKTCRMPPSHAPMRFGTATRSGAQMREHAGAQI